MNRKKIIVNLLVVCLFVSLFSPYLVYGETIKEPDNLYARSCVLMDGKSGRVLYEKEGNTIMPMASTTKIMTLIVALENSQMDEKVEISSYAASQPKVHLGMTCGQQFYLKDLCYSLMLESHNDSAVAIAEHIGSKKLNLKRAGERTKEDSKKAVRKFIDLMNEKARDIGCFDTWFVTPNGLDGESVLSDGSKKIHSTTADNLARIMMYCITTSKEKDSFLQITSVSNYSFTDLNKKSSHSCTNRNAFLTMMDGALTGKTGFTAKAGYCYVGAVQQDDKLLIVSLLACGWPNNKTYKWKDMKKLVQYGLDNYSYETITVKKDDFEHIWVEDGAAPIGKQAYVPVYMEDGTLNLLLRKDERAQIDCELVNYLKAPVKKGDKAGIVTCKIKDEIMAVYPVYVKKTVEKKSFFTCLYNLLNFFLLKK